MQLTREQTLPISPQAAWTALNDVTILKECIPGCESLTAVSSDEFDLVIVTAVGPLKARFRGKLRLADLDPPEGYTLRFEGRGGPVGHTKGEARVQLEALGEDETNLRYTAHATVDGTLARLGGFLIDLAAEKLSADFFSAFDKHVRKLYVRLQP